ncbi:MAG TPA: cation diffusion facilitator family transporter [Burkholderiales bacterium]|nr:cation diffusion facilitator family transporter [Burkholderiales bacterium]
MSGTRRFALLSIAAALATIALKAAAWWITGSVGLLSDALEGTINLAAAIFALAMLSVAARPPDDEHAFGYGKAEYFSSGIEGTLIFLAAIAIAWTAIERLIAPRPLENIGAGLLVSAAASFVNFAVARRLMAAGRQYRSIALEADARHLMTDVWTSAGVIVGVGAVWLSGWDRLDPLIALAVAAHILGAGYYLMRRSFQGLLDRSLPEDEMRILNGVLDRHRAQGMDFHAVRTRQAGARSFITLHVLVPAEWTVAQGHRLAHKVEDDILAALPGAAVLTHVEPLGRPESYQDMELDAPADGGAEKRDS